MKLRNKFSGEIKDVESIGHEKSLRDKYGPRITLSWNTEYESLRECKTYKSLAEVNAEWEDAPEEPKEYWYVDDAGVEQIDQVLSSVINMRKSIGNYFSSREEAELAVRKLNAWRRLRDKGFKFELCEYDGGNYTERIRTGKILFRVKDCEEVDGLLELLFGSDE